MKRKWRQELKRDEKKALAFLDRTIKVLAHDLSDARTKRRKLQNRATARIKR